MWPHYIIISTKVLHSFALQVQEYKSLSRAHLQNLNYSKLRTPVLILRKVSSQSKFGPPLDLLLVKYYHFTHFDLCILILTIDQFDYWLNLHWSEI